MRTFIKDYKINFVDDNNVFVGFDNESSCCEDFGWLISRELPTENQLFQNAQDENHEGFNFDTTFEELNSSGGDSGA